jgi:hypothetical protein
LGEADRWEGDQLMSSLIFALSETEIILGTDTLATPYDGAAPFFCSKAFTLPHMNMILAASGDTGFLERWWAYINTRMIFPGIETLGWSAQSELQAMWREYKQEMALPVEREQAIFHFGISEFTGEMLGFKHISWDDFLPEEISVRAKGQSMFFAKPDCAKPDLDDGMGSFPKAFLPMMLDQRARQAAQPDGKVTIGGEIQIHHLNRAGCAVYKLARFDDYASVEKALWGDFRGKYAAKQQSQRSGGI